MSEKTNSLDLKSIYAVKAGMTRIFAEDGTHIPVTVVKLIPNVISQVKTVEKDGYSAYQVAYYEKREKLVTKPLRGHLKKGGIDKAYARFAEVKIEANAENLGKEVTYGTFEKTSFVDVTGTSKGKGFQGVMKRFNFKGGPAAHGSKFHRTTGSIGQHTDPARVFKGKKMPGHMGNKQRTVQNLEVVEVNLEKGFMLIKGSLPGSKNDFIRISKSIKK